jgi:hypothetical protein
MLNNLMRHCCAQFAETQTHLHVESRYEWSYTSTPPIRLHGVDRENFTLPFTNCNNNLNMPDKG